MRRASPTELRYARHMFTTSDRCPRRCTCTAPWTAACCRRPRGAPAGYVDGPYRWRVIDGAGHFPHEERPEVLDTELLGWLADPDPNPNGEQGPRPGRAAEERAPPRRPGTPA